MSIKIKLLLGFGVVILITLATGVAGYYGIQRIDRKIHTVLDGVARLAEHSARARANVGGTRRYEKDVFLNIDNKEKVRSYYKKWNKELKSLNARIASLEKYAVEEKDKKTVANMKKTADEYKTGFNEVYARVLSGAIESPQDGNRAMGKYKTPIRDLGVDARDFATLNVKRMQSVKKIIEEETKVVVGALIGIVGLAFLISLGFGFFLARLITLPLNKVTEGMAAIARGDLTQSRLDLDSSDEIGRLSKSYNTLLENLSKMVAQIKESSQQLSTSAAEFTTMGNDLALSSKQMSDQAALSAAGAEEMITSINEVARNSNMAAKLTEEANKLADFSNGTVANLGKAARSISKIVDVILDIADQTNLLSLNAAIEAAGAGEAGKGFAIVANEVKELAKQTSKASEDIQNQIEGIQNSSEETIKAITDTTKSIQSVSEIASSTATAVEEQTITTRDIAKNITQVSDSSNNNAAGARQLNEAAENLSRMAVRLSELVESFAI